MKEKSGLGFSKRAITLREKFSSKIISRFVIIFILSMLVYMFTNTYPITALAGFVGIISGSIIILFIIIFLIFYFLEKIKYSGDKSTGAKKKKGNIIRGVKKRPVKKKIAKKTIKKKTTKRVVKK